MTNNKFDDLLIQLGTKKWNYLYFGVICWYCFFLPGQVLSIVFAVPPVSFTCIVPEEESIPVQDLNDACTYTVNSSHGEPEERACTQWEFDNSTFTSTLTSEYQLVCDRSFLKASYHGIFMLGNVFGPLVAGILADKYGRKPVAVAGGLFFAFIAVIIPFLTNFGVILFLRFVMGFANLPTAYILAMEVCEPQKRSFVGILLALPWALGTMAFGGIAYFVRDWHWLQFIMSVPLVILLPAIWLLDESPRWLIVMGYHDRALAILNKAAKWNKSELPPQAQMRDIMRDIQDEANSSSDSTSENSLTESQRIHDGKKKETHSFKNSCALKCGLCSTVHIRIITLVMTLCFCLSSLVFHGLTMSAKDFSINIFVYIIIGGLTEVPAYTLPAIVVAKFGRRIPLALCFLECGIALFALTITPKDMGILVLILAMTGKLGISSAGQMAYLYLSELYPTEYRLQGMGVAILAQRLGSIVAPLLVQILGPVVWWAPSVAMGVMSIFAGIATLKLPETLGAVLPDTLADLEELFNNKNKRRKSETKKPEEIAPLST